MSEKDKRSPPIIAGTFRQKRLAPIITHTVECRDTPSIEDLLRRLLTEDRIERREGQE